MQDQQNNTQADDQAVTNEPTTTSPAPDAPVSDDTTSTKPETPVVAGTEQKPKPPKITWI
ncbi:hypothetical protein IT414_00790 [bacterium]|nr:hypothetical protein [bacterium]